MTGSMRLAAQIFVGVSLVAEVLGITDPAAAQSSAPSKYGYEQKIMADPATGPPPLKKRLAVARFDDSTTVEDSPFGVLDPATLKKHQNDDINSPLSKDLAVIRRGFTERLITALFATDRFIVVERRDIHKILREQDFSKMERISPSGSVVQGETLSTHYIITGLITFDRGEATDTTSDSEVETTLPIPGSRYRTTVGGGRATPKDPGATEAQGSDEGPTMGDRSLLSDLQFQCPRSTRVSPKYALHLRVYDVSTSQVVSAVRVSADSQWCLIKAGVHRVIAQMDKFPWKSRVSAVEGDRVVMEGGRDVNMNYGYRLVHQPFQGRGAPAEQHRGSSPELSLVEIRETTSVAQPVILAPRPDIRPGDWVVFNPILTSPR